MCECVDDPHVYPGWGCHRCHVFNGIQRATCKSCGEVRCNPLLADRLTGRHFETVLEATVGNDNNCANPVPR